MRELKPYMVMIGIHSLIPTKGQPNYAPMYLKQKTLTKKTETSSPVTQLALEITQTDLFNKNSL